MGFNHVAIAVGDASTGSLPNQRAIRSRSQLRGLDLAAEGVAQVLAGVGLAGAQPRKSFSGRGAAGSGPR